MRIIYIYSVKNAAKQIDNSEWVPFIVNQQKFRNVQFAATVFVSHPQTICTFCSFCHFFSLCSFDLYQREFN